MSRMFVTRWLCFLLASVILIAVSGCGGSGTGPKRTYGEVTGKVTYKGESLKMGKVIFQPPSGQPVAGDIKPDGTYSLQGVVGPNTVMIVSRDAAPTPNASAGPLTSVPPPKSHVPEIYGTPKSNLAFEVKAGKNTADFDLK